MFSPELHVSAPAAELDSMLRLKTRPAVCPPQAEDRKTKTTRVQRGAGVQINTGKFSPGGSGDFSFKTRRFVFY